MIGCCKRGRKALVIAGAVLALGAAGLAVAHGMAWWPFYAEPASGQATQLAAPETQTTLSKLKAMGAKHTAPEEMLSRALARLHEEALAHFYSDPRFGMARLPPVFEKVVKDWKMPWFSPGELDGAEGIPFKAEMDKIHTASVGDFLDPKAPLPAEDVAVFRFRGLDGELLKFDKGKKVWEAKSVDLVGLIKHDEPVAYVSEKLPDMKKLSKTPIRPLDEFEVAGLDTLKKGENLYGRSRDGVIRMLGAVRANASCLTCHDDKKEGDLLGAFSYTLREAEYVRKAGGKAIPIIDSPPLK